MPNARQYAFSEFERNTLASHAIAYPHHWDGTISIDDVCHAFYSPAPASCGAGLTTAYAGQIMHQPAWSLYDAILLAGIQPTARGFRILPVLPTSTFTVGLPDVGVSYAARGAHGYVEAESGPLVMQVKAPGTGRWSVTVGTRRVPSVTRGGIVTFTLRAQAHRAVGWDIRTAAAGS